MLYALGWFVGAVVLLVVLILVFVRSLDLTAHRSRLESLVSAAVGREVTFDGALTVELSLFPTVSVGGVHIANPDWSPRANFAEADSLAIQFALLPLVRGELEIVSIVVEDADVLFERALDGSDNWTFGATTPRGGRTESRLPAIASLKIERGVVGYQSTSGELYQLVISSATFFLSQGRPVRIKASGLYQNLPATLVFRGGALAELSSPSAAWPVEAEFTLGDASLAIAGNLATPELLQGWELKVALSGEETAPLEAVLARNLPPFGPFQLGGTLTNRRGRYHLDNFRAQIGENSLTGELRLVVDETPLLSGRLSATSIAAGGLLMRVKAEGKADEAPLSMLDQPFALPDLSALDLDLSVDIHELVYPSVPALRDLCLLVRLTQGRLKVSSRRMTVAGVAVRAAATLQVRKDRLDVEIDAETEMLPIARRKAGGSGAPRISGKAHGVAVRASSAGRSLRQLVSQGSIDLRVGFAALQLPAPSEAQPAAVTLSRVRVLSMAGGPVRLNANVRYTKIPVDLHVETATVADLLWERAAWPVRLEAKAQGMQLAAKGVIIDPLGTRQLRLDVDLAGKSLAALEPHVDLSLPSQGPFHVKGELQFGGNVAKFSKTSLQLGENRIHGDVTWRSDQPLPRLDAHLSGQEIVVDELVPESEESSDQEPSNNVPNGRVIPDFTLPVTILPRIEAAIQLDFRRLKLRGTTLGDLSLTGQLKEDRLTLYPLIVTLSGTRLIASLDLQDLASAPLFDAWMKVPELDYGRLLRDLKVVSGIEGSAEIEVALSGRGTTLREILSHADGRISVTGGVGRIPNRYLALWGGGAWKLLVPEELQGAGKSTRVNCIVSHHTVSNGVMRGQLLMDTTDVTIAGEQATALDTEEIRAVLQPAPKGFTVLNLGTPVEVTGTLTNMQAKLSTGDTLLVLGKIAIGVAMPSALLYLLADVGTDETNVCEAAMVRREGAVGSAEGSGLINKARNLLRKLQRPLEGKAGSP